MQVRWDTLVEVPTTCGKKKTASQGRNKLQLIQVGFPGRRPGLSFLATTPASSVLYYAVVLTWKTGSTITIPVHYFEYDIIRIVHEDNLFKGTVSENGLCLFLPGLRV